MGDRPPPIPNHPLSRSGISQLIKQQGRSTMTAERTYFGLLPWMTAFFIAMAYLESAVVVYLRALYYPEGFDFPLAPMDGSLVWTELGREGATILMLLAVAAVAARRALERFAWFCFGF